jgi:hypothetical protein
MDKITTLTTVVGSLVAVSTFANAVWQYRRKVHLEIFRMYADRYNAILRPDIYEKWVGAIQGDRDHWIELNSTMIQYLNLIWEEYYLSRDGLIPKRLWQLWLPEMDRVLSSEFAKSVAKAYDSHFQDELTSGSKMRSRPSPSILHSP